MKKLEGQPIPNKFAPLHLFGTIKDNLARKIQQKTERIETIRREVQESSGIRP